jgi:hypothetical protein
VKDTVELEAGQAVIGCDPVFVLFGDIEAQEDLAIALVGELFEDPAHEGGVLAVQQLAERARVGGHGLGAGLAVGLGLPAGRLAVVLDGEAAGDLDHEAREGGGLAQLAVAELFEDKAEGVLEEVLGLGPAVGVAIEEDRYTPAVQLDDPFLSPAVAGLDPGDQALRPVLVREDCLVPGQKRFPCRREWQADSSTGLGPSQCPLPVVDLTTVSDDQDDDQPIIVLNPVDDSIIAHPVAIRPAQRTLQGLDIRVAARSGPERVEAAVQPSLQRRIGFLVKPLS